MHNAKSDKNQPEIVDALRTAGATVQVLSSVGKGVPDLLVGIGGSNYLIEVKDGTGSKLNERQIKWHGEWKGQVAVIHTISELHQFLNYVLTRD